MNSARGYEGLSRVSSDAKKKKSNRMLSRALRARTLKIARINPSFLNYSTEKAPTFSHPKANFSSAKFAGKVEQIKKVNDYVKKQGDNHSKKVLSPKKLLEKKSIVFTTNWESMTCFLKKNP